ncbi:YhjD/YihY/BrkB family envelope integrity protein [Microbispora hainanensis]|uniref:YhjD/YihY/BrkB family envelope integrity protein n=1 Tax=Microbispora hainanensis TaxID=568844 RepID=UPI0033D4DFFB
MLASPCASPSISRAPRCCGPPGRRVGASRHESAGGALGDDRRAGGTPRPRPGGQGRRIGGALVGARPAHPGGSALLYRFVPGSRRESQWRSVAWGVGLAMPALVAMSAGLSIFTTGFGRFGQAYGTVAAVAGLMLWLYLSTSLHADRAAGRRGQRSGSSAICGPCPDKSVSSDLHGAAGDACPTVACPQEAASPACSPRSPARGN